jgi:hypothetical protein
MKFRMVSSVCFILYAECFIFIHPLAALDAPLVLPFEPEPKAGVSLSATAAAFQQSIMLSDSTVYSGKVELTQGAALKWYRLDTKQFEDLDVEKIRRIEFKVAKSEVKYSYRFKEAGSNEKVQDGPGYVDQEYEMEVTTTDGKMARGHSMGQAIYVESKGQRYKFILRKNQKGEPGEEASKIIYVKRILLRP